MRKSKEFVVRGHQSNRHFTLKKRRLQRWPPFAKGSLSGSCDRIGELLQAFSSQECENYLIHQGYSAT